MAARRTGAPPAAGRRHARPARRRRRSSDSLEAARRPQAAGDIPAPERTPAGRTSDTANLADPAVPDSHSALPGTGASAGIPGEDSWARRTAPQAPEAAAPA